MYFDWIYFEINFERKQSYFSRVIKSKLVTMESELLQKLETKSTDPGQPKLVSVFFYIKNLKI